MHTAATFETLATAPPRPRRTPRDEEAPPAETEEPTRDG